MRWKPIVAGWVLLLPSMTGLTQNKTSKSVTPIILERDQGEQRIRRPRSVPMASSTFTLKVDPQNGSSDHLVLGTEEMPPGQVIPRHKHLGQDEILFIHSGVAHVWLGDQERDAHTGAVIFIPSGTWISLKNTGNESLSLIFVFSAPGFEEYLRCTSVPAGQQATPLSDDAFQDCQHKGHAVFQAK